MSREEELEKNLAQTSEILAMVLNEVGPVTIRKNDRKPIPEGAMIEVDINNEDQSVTISLGVPNETG